MYFDDMSMPSRNNSTEFLLISVALKNETAITGLLVFKFALGKGDKIRISDSSGSPK